MSRTQYAMTEGLWGCEPPAGPGQGPGRSQGGKAQGSSEDPAFYSTKRSRKITVVVLFFPKGQLYWIKKCLLIHSSQFFVAKGYCAAHKVETIA